MEIIVAFLVFVAAYYWVPAIYTLCAWAIRSLLEGKETR
jgi:hypothetical protein